MTFAESLFERTDANGTIPWKLAARAASLHGLLIDFICDYGAEWQWVDPESGSPIGVDTGELLVWLGY